MATRIPTAFTNSSTTESAADMIAAANHYDMPMVIRTITEGDGAVTEIDSKTGKPVEAPAAEAVSTEVEKPAETETVAEAEAKKPVAATEPTAEEKAATDKAVADAAAQIEADRVKAEADAAALELTEADKAKHKKLLKQIDKLTGRLRTEEDKSGKLSDELEDARNKLAGIKPAAESPAEPEAPKAPERPKRPKLGDFAYDQEKYEAALETYDAAMDKYETDRETFIRDTAVKQVREDQARTNAEAVAQQREHDWQEAKSAYPDIDDKLTESTGQISSAMQAVLRGVYEPKEAWALLDYLADNPEASTAIAQKTLSASAKPTMIEFAGLVATATRELTLLEVKIQRSEAAKKGASKKDDAAPVAPTTPAAATKTVTPPPAVPVTPKPPVSKAEPPITPVTSHADSTGKVDLSSEKTPTAVYLAERQKQMIDRMKRRG